MNLRIACYVIAFAISLAAFAGAYGYATDANNAATRANNLPAARAARATHLEEARVAALVVALRARGQDFVDREFRNAIAGDAALAGAILSKGGNAVLDAAYYAADRAATDNAKGDDDAANAANANARAASTARAAYGMAAAVSLAAFAGAYILDKRTQPKPMTSPRQDE